MHMQLRCVPAASAPDVAKLLAVLADAKINLVTIGGSDVEFGGELALVPSDGQEDLALQVLRDNGYNVRPVHKDDPDSGLTVCEVDDKPGKLLECLAAVSSANLDRGRIIRDILVGPAMTEPGHEGKIPVQIYSAEIRSKANTTTSGTAA